MVKLKRAITEFVAGGLTGCVTKTCIAPLDRTKLLLQAHHPYYKDFGVFKCVNEIVRREGLGSLWKGNTMMMIRIFPYSGVQFFCYERFSRVFKEHLGNSQLNKLLAGSCAGLSATIATYPLDFLRARITYQITGEHRYHSNWNALTSIYKQEGGVRAFYRGMSASFIGMVPYAGISFYTFHTLKEYCIRYFPDILARPDVNAPDTLVLKVHVAGLCGGMAGAISQTVSFPLDVARRRMQLASMLPNSHKYIGIWSTLSNVYKDNGIVRGLYRGLSVNYIRVIPQQAIAFTTYEIFKEHLGLNVLEE